MHRVFMAIGALVLVAFAGLGAIAVSAGSSTPVDTLRASPGQAESRKWMPSNFRVEIDGIPTATFEAVELGSAIEVVEFRPGGETGPSIKLPGNVSYRNILLVTSPDNPALQPLWEWHDVMASGGSDRRDGAIIALDRNGNEVARYKFTNAWPSKWEVPSTPADSPDIAMETIELAVERVERQ